MFEGWPERTCRVLMLTSSLLAFLSQRVEALETFYVGTNCGFYVSRYQSAGILRFDTTKFSDSHGFRRECKVKVGPTLVPGSGGEGKVLFYFTTFDLPGTCSDLSVTVFDGSSTKDALVTGISSPLCGHDASLTETDRVFTTSAFVFLILVNSSQSTVANSGGGFTLKFSAFYDGPCDDNENVVACKNSRCIAKAYHCHSEIDVCGSEEESVCAPPVKEDLTFFEEISEKIKPYTKEIAIGMGALIVLYYLYTVYRKIVNKHGSLSNFISQKLCGKTSTNRRISRDVGIRSSRSSLAPSIELQARTDADDPLNVDQSGSRQLDPGAQGGPDALPTSYNTTGPLGPPPSYNEQGAPPSSHETPGPLLPPPSYDLVMSNEDKYKQDPDKGLLS